jgi:DedD protein
MEENKQEKKKLLLVAVSVGVVLLIILIIPLLIISPGKDFGSSWQEQSAVIEPPNLTQGWESVREPEPVIDTRVDEITAAPENPSRTASNVTTITVPAPRSVAVPDTVVSPVRQASRARPVQAAEPPKETHAAAKPAAVKPAAAKPAVEKPAVVVAKPAKTYDSSNFWIQTGAFSTIKYAEGAKDYLAERGITSIIEDPVINGKTWYRVRVGPYTTRDEANYWLALVKSIDGFAASQVWETDAR